MKEKMKKCKYCKSEIDKKAKICQVCKKKQGKKAIKIVLLSLLVIFIIAIAADSGNNSKDNPKKEKEFVNIGEKVTVNNVDYIVDEKKIQKEISAGNGFLKYTADGEYLLIKLTITNNSKSSININATDFVLKDENGATYASSVLLTVDNMDMFNYETLNPNATESGYIAYDIANRDLHYTLTINGDDWFDSAGIEVSIQ